MPALHLRLQLVCGAPTSELLAGLNATDFLDYLVSDAAVAQGLVNLDLLVTMIPGAPFESPVGAPEAIFPPPYEYGNFRCVSRLRLLPRLYNHEVRAYTVVQNCSTHSTAGWPARTFEMPYGGWGRACDSPCRKMFSNMPTCASVVL